MPNKMATMQCCNEDCTSNVEPCYICPCLIGEYNIDILVKTHYVAYNANGEEFEETREDCFDRQKEHLFGLITLAPFGAGTLPAFCQGHWYQCSFGGQCTGFAIDYCDGPLGPVPLKAYPRWELHLDATTNKVIVQLLWWQDVCENTGILSIWAGIRWEYEFDSDACEDVLTLAHTGKVELLTFEDEHTTTWVEVATDGDLIAYEYWGVDEPRAGFYTTGINDPPEIFLNREDCSEDPCCAEEGGGPTALMDLTVGEVSSCAIEATDVSVAGTCGEIVKRLWVIETWFDEDEPTITGDACADEPDEKKSFYGEGEDNETIFTQGARDCGGNWFRITLHVWDEKNCHSEATSDFFTCCNCEDDNNELCADPPGGLTAELISDEGEVPCVYRLTATGSFSGYDGVCGDTSFIEVWGIGSCAAVDPDEDCECEEIAAGDCGGPDCSRVIALGSHVDVTIDHSVTIKWRAREGSCGCPGEIRELELPCLNCECCVDPLASVFVTIAGYVDGEPGCEPCADKIDGTYELLFEEPCLARLILTDYFLCGESNPVPTPQDLQIEVLIDCTSVLGHIAITGAVSTPSAGTMIFYREIAVAEIPAEDCADILDGNVPNTSPGGPCIIVLCDGCDATMSLDFIAV